MTTPNTIYLQWLDEDGERPEEVTWCEDRVLPTDVEYRRATAQEPTVNLQQVLLDAEWEQRMETSVDAARFTGCRTRRQWHGENDFLKDKWGYTDEQLAAHAASVASDYHRQQVKLWKGLREPRERREREREYVRLRRLDTVELIYNIPSLSSDEVNGGLTDSGWLILNYALRQLRERFRVLVKEKNDASS